MFVLLVFILLNPPQQSYKFGSEHTIGGQKYILESGGLNDDGSIDFLFKLK